MPESGQRSEEEEELPVIYDYFYNFMLAYETTLCSIFRDISEIIQKIWLTTSIKKLRTKTSVDN